MLKNLKSYAIIKNQIFKANENKAIEAEISARIIKYFKYDSNPVMYGKIENEVFSICSDTDPLATEVFSLVSDFNIEEKIIAVNSYLRKTLSSEDFKNMSKDEFLDILISECFNNDEFYEIADKMAMNIITN